VGATVFATNANSFCADLNKGISKKLDGLLTGLIPNSAHGDVILRVSILNSVGVYKTGTVRWSFKTSNPRPRPRAHLEVGLYITDQGGMQSSSNCRRGASEGFDYTDSPIMAAMMAGAGTKNNCGARVRSGWALSVG